MSLYPEKFVEWTKDLKNVKKQKATFDKIQIFYKTITKPEHLEYEAKILFKYSVQTLLEVDQGEDSQIYVKLLIYLYNVCVELESKKFHIFIPLLYNYLINCNNQVKPSKSIQMCQFLNTVILDNHVQDIALIDIMCKLIVKSFQQQAKLNEAPNAEDQQYAIDFVIKAYLFIIDNYSATDETKLIEHFHLFFDNNFALLYRLFGLNEEKADIFFTKSLDIFKRSRLKEENLEDLFIKTISYIDFIMNFGHASPEFRHFSEILSLFQLKNDVPATCHQILRKFIAFYNDKTGNEGLLDDIMLLLKHITSQEAYLRTPVVIETAIALAKYLYRKVYKLKNDGKASKVAQKIIEMVKFMLKIVKYCPNETKGFCDKCVYTNRHIVDNLTTVVIQMADILCQNQLKVSFATVTFFIKYKFQILSELKCDEKGQLIDAGIRYLAGFMKTYMQNEAYTYTQEVTDIIHLMIKSKYEYNIEVLTNEHLVRLFEFSIQKVTADEWSKSIDIKLIKLLLMLRGQWTCATQSIHDVLGTIMVQQKDYASESLKHLDILELIEKKTIKNHGLKVDFNLTKVEAAALISLQMESAYKYGTQLSLNVLFEKLCKLEQNPLVLGMCLFFFDEKKYKQVDVATLASIENKLEKLKPSDKDGKLKKAACLGLINYYSFLKGSEDVKNKIQKFNVNAVSIKNNQLSETLMLNQMDEEAQQLENLDKSFDNFNQMIMIMADNNFKQIKLLCSITQICKILENISLTYMMRYFPRKAVQAQILQYLLANNKGSDAEILCPLAYIVENYQNYDFVRKSINKPSLVPDLQSMIKIAENCIENNYANFKELKQNRRFYYLQLLLNLALYKGASNKLNESTKYLERAKSILKNDDTDQNYEQIIKGQFYWVMFQLLTKHNFTLDLTVSPRIFVKLLLREYNQIQNSLKEYSLNMAITVINVVVELVQYVISRYDIDRIEAYMEMVLKFTLRKGMGIRSAQIFALYSLVHINSEKIEDCEIKLSYLDKILSFESPRLEYNVAAKEKSPAPTHQSLQIMIPGVQHIDLNHIDGTRKSVQLLKSPVKLQHNLRPNEKESYYEMFKQYLIMHRDDCDCKYCKFPQYLLFSFQIVCLHARLLFLNDRLDECEKLYSKINEYWEYLMNKITANQHFAEFRDEFYIFTIRYLLQYSHTNIRVGNFQKTQHIYDMTNRIMNENLENVDIAVRQDVDINIKSLKFLMFPPTETNRSIYPSYSEFKRLNDIKLPEKTPKILTKYQSKAPPKTVASSLFTSKISSFGYLSQKQLKLNSDSSDDSPGVVSISDLYGVGGSERKPRLVSIFLDSPITAKKITRKVVKNVSPKSTTEILEPVKSSRRGRPKKTDKAEVAETLSTPMKPKVRKQALPSLRKEHKSDMVPSTPILKKSSSNECVEDALIASMEKLKITKSVRRKKDEMKTASKKSVKISDKADVIIIEDSPAEEIDTSVDHILTTASKRSLRRKESDKNKLKPTQLDFETSPIDGNNNKEDAENAAKTITRKRTTKVSSRVRTT